MYAKQSTRVADSRVFWGFFSNNFYNVKKLRCNSHAIRYTDHKKYSGLMTFHSVYIQLNNTWNNI